MDIERPISPHLQIYKPTLTMVMSIAHRITGIGLYLGTPIIAAWIAANAFEGDILETAENIRKSLIGTLFLIAYSWALMHHMIGGIRHLIWDFGYGFDENQPHKLALATLIGGITATIILWVIICIV